MAASTWTWIRNTSTLNSAANWSLTSGPGNASGHPSAGDTAIFTGAGQPPRFSDTQISGGATLDLTGTGTVQLPNDTHFLNTTSIDSSITINATGTATSILTQGTFTNGGTIEVTGNGDSLAITAAANGTLAGWFENDGSVIVDQGDRLTVTATAGATFAGFGTVFVAGGTALIDGALATFPNAGNFSIGQSGSLEIQQSGA